MKRTTTLFLICMCLAIFGFSQKAIEFNQPASDINSFVTIGKSFSLQNQQLQGGGSHYYLFYALRKLNYLNVTLNVPKTNLTLFFNPVYMDSTVRSSFSNGTGYVSLNRDGMVFDPKSPFYDRDNDLSLVPPLTKNDAYVIDTVVFTAAYKRVSASSQVDTLYVEICYGDTNAVSSWLNYYNSLVSRVHTSLPKLNSAPTQGNVSHLTGTNKLIIKYPLTEADSVDELSFSRLKNIVVKLPGGGLWVPANNIFAVTCTFVPGATYTPGDVVWTSGSTAVNPQTQNGFATVLMGQAGTVSGAKQYFTDSASLLTRNAYVNFSKYQRYGLFSGANAFLNTCMFMNVNYAPYISATITTSLTGIKESGKNATAVLSPNVPNPFADHTAINYVLNEAANVSLTVYDITGKRVQSLEETKKPAGIYSVQFNAGSLESGVYFYTLNAGETSITRRMSIVK